MGPVMYLMDDTIQKARELRERLDRFARWGYVTREQAQALHSAIAPDLPCVLAIHTHAKKGALHVKLRTKRGELAFRLDPSARMHSADSGALETLG